MSQSLPLQPSLRPSEGGIRQQEAKRDIIATMEARKIEARRRYQQRQQQLHLEGEEKRQGLLGTTNFAATSPTDSTIATRVATTTATSTVVTQSPYQDDMLYAGIEARKLEARKRFQQRQQQRQSAMSRYPSTTATATATATAITTMDKIQDEEELVSTFETYDEEELISILTDARKAFAEKRNATYWSVITPRQICTIAKLAPVTLDELRKVGMSDEKFEEYGAEIVNLVNMFIYKNDLGEYIDNRSEQKPKTERSERKPKTERSERKPITERSERKPKTERSLSPNGNGNGNNTPNAPIKNNNKNKTTNPYAKSPVQNKKYKKGSAEKQSMISQTFLVSKHDEQAVKGEDLFRSTLDKMTRRRYK